MNTAPLVLAVAASALLSGCFFPGMPTIRSNSTNSNASNSNASNNAPPPSSNAGRSSSSSSGSKSSGRKSSTPKPPSVVSVSIKNECKKKVKLFFGKKPKFGSGTYSSIGSNTRTSRSMRPGDMVWIVDDSQNGISAATASAGTRNLKITRSCTGIVPD